jgi:uncharacterized protein (TIGR00255 family)
MTGFGAASLPIGSTEASLELRSVNSRHLKLNLRLPSGMEAVEEELREYITGELRRGHIDVALRIDGSAAGETSIEVNTQRVEAILKAYRTIAQQFEVAGEVDLTLLAKSDRLFIERSQTLTELIDPAVFKDAAVRAVAQLVAMREKEGQRLAADLRRRLTAIASGLTKVSEGAPERLARERARLTQAVADLTGSLDLEDDRIAREIALLADKWDLGEELVRAHAHLEAFEDLMSAPGEEPVGKRLGFLSQELLREINTIGSKANDSGIQHVVVEMKNELETMREQIENVE